MSSRSRLHAVGGHYSRGSSETVFDRWLTTARHGLFGVLFTMAKDTSSHTKWSVFGMGYDFLQLLAYPLYAGKYFPWSEMENMSWLLKFLTNINPNYAADSISPMLKITLLFFACAWVAATVLTVVWAAYSFSTGAFSTVAPLKLLRATARLTATALFLPFAAMLISAFKCKTGGKWSVTDWECYGVEHVLIMALVAVLLPCFWAFTLCVAAVFFDKDYASYNITARAHGRVALLMISIKTTLTLVFTVAAEADPWFLHVVLLLSGALWLYLFLAFLPFYNQRMNQAWSAFAAVFLWASIAAILAKVLANPQAAVGGYVFYIGIPTAAYTGYALAYMRYERLVMSAANASVLSTAFKSPWEVEMRVRYLLRDVIAVERAANKTHGHGHGHGDAASSHAHATAQRRRTSVHPTNNAAGAAYSVLAPMSGEAWVTSPSAAGISVHVGEQMSVHGEGRRASLHSNIDIDIPQMQQLYPAPSPHSLHHGDEDLEEQQFQAKKEALVVEAFELYEYARTTLFPHSAILDLFFANFIRCFVGDRDLELIIVNEGLAKDPAIDIRFLLFQAKRQIEEGAGANVGGGHATPHAGAKKGKGSGKMTIIERVQYEQFMGESLDASMKARNMELAFWSELRMPQPDLHKLHAHAEAMNTAINKATGAFERLLAMRPNSVEVLQAYAVFLLEVKRETAAANKYFDLADEITASAEADILQAEQQAVYAASISNPNRRSSNGSFRTGPSLIADGSQQGALLAAGSHHRGISLGSNAPRRAVTTMSMHSRAPTLDTCSQDRTAQLAGGSQAASLHHSHIHLAAPSQAESQFPSSGYIAGPSSLPRSSPHAHNVAHRHSIHSVHPSVAHSVHSVHTPNMSPGYPAGMSTHGSVGAQHGWSIVRTLSVGFPHKTNTSRPHISIGDSPTASTNNLDNGRRKSITSPGILSAGSVAESHFSPLLARSGTVTGNNATAGIDDPLIKGRNKRDSAAVAAYAAAVNRGRRASMTAARSSVGSTSFNRAESTDARAVGGSGRRGENKQSRRQSSLDPSISRQRSNGRANGALVQAKSIDAAVKLNADALHGTKRDHSNSAKASLAQPAGRGRQRGPRDPEPKVADTTIDVTATGKDTKPRTNNNVKDEGRLAVRMQSLKKIAQSKRGLDMPATAREEEAEEARLQQEEEERARKMAKASNKAKMEARRRKQDATESAAASLRMAIKSKSKTAEPSLALLTKVLLIIFILGAAMDIVLVTVHRVVATEYQSLGELMQLSANRQAAAESIIRNTYALTRMSAGIVPFTEAQYNHTSMYLKQSGVAFDALHRQLYLATSSDADEQFLYSGASLVVADMSIAPGGARTYTRRSLSLANTGIEFSSKITQVLALPLANVSVYHPSVYYILQNGPAALRDGMNQSQAVLARRTDGQNGKLWLVDVAMVIVGTALFCGLVLLVVLPVVSTVKAHTDEIFAIFLNLPDHILEEMEVNCASQVKQLKALADNAEMGMLVDGDTTPGIESTRQLVQTEDDVMGASDNSYDDMDRPLQRLPSKSHNTAGIPNIKSALRMDKSGLAKQVGDTLLPTINSGSGSYMDYMRSRGIRSDKGFKRSCGMQLRLTARFAWPSILLGIYFVAMWGYQHSTRLAVADSQKHNYMASRVISLVWSIDNDVTSTVMDMPPSRPSYTLPSPAPAVASYAACNMSQLSVSLGLLDASVAVANGIEDTMLYGDINQGIKSLLSMDSTIADLMLQNACAASGMPHDCAPTSAGAFDDFLDNDDLQDQQSYASGFYHGIMTDGLQAALREYFLLGRRIFQSRLVAFKGDPSTCPPLQMDGTSPIRVFDALGAKYVAKAFQHVHARIVLNMQDILDRYTIGHAVLTAISLLLLLLVYIFFTRRSIRKMDGDMKRTRGTLLLFPTEVLADVAKLINLVDEEKGGSEIFAAVS